jgi:hypothetical protein
VPGVGEAAGASKAMFLGVKARNADKAKLAAAEQMEGAGADKKAIWNATGWFRGVDKKWRFEVPDDKAQLGELDEVAMKRGVPLANVYRNSEVMDAYPDLAAMPVSVRYDIGGYNAAHTPGTGIAFDASYMGSRSREDLRSTLAHEVQHPIQEIEGFGRGGNHWTTVIDEWHPLAEEAEALRAAGHSDAWDDWYNSPDIRRKNWTFREAKANFPAELQTPEYLRLAEIQEAQNALRTRGVDGYRRLAGEVEARNVQTRLDMTPGQRREYAPWETQDVPDDEQFVIWGGGDAASAPRPYPMAPRDRWYGDADYEARGGRLVDMTPDEFLAVARPLEMDDTSLENIADLRAHMEAGRELDPLMIGSGRAGHDGRHRAYAAKELGIATVPVLRFDDPQMETWDITPRR